jgi:NDP-sugar pyrophosphorylase family protein
MRAMILAAGLGTRLRPLTNDRPKALVEIAGRTLLEITLSRLRSAGIHDVIVNVHHFADRVIAYLDSHHCFGMHIEISREEILLDTGGGLKRAGYFFHESSEPFLLHNVDVMSTIDLGKMVRFHEQHQALATLAVQKRKTSRYLLFDDSLQLCGRRAGLDGEPEMARPANHVDALAFAGIHVVSPRLLDLISEDGVFPIVPCYLCMAREGEKIVGFRADEYYWRDLGTPENVKQAEQDLKSGVLVQ